MSRTSARRTIVPTVTARDASKEHRISATLEFITPMFGGGVRLDPKAPHHKHPDLITPVRGASLRGQLREWWRRACGAGLTNDVMRAREKVLWGWASTKDDPAKGLVALRVDARALTRTEVPVYRLDDKGRPRPVDGSSASLAYGAFPLQPAQSAQGSAGGTLSRWSGQFTVDLELAPLGKIYCKSANEAWAGARSGSIEDLLWREVERTWRAFVLFGGLGGRTRRGFGAVKVVSDGAPRLSDTAAELEWTQRLVAVRRPNAEDAQKWALGRLQAYRQAPDLGRNSGSGPRPGRSRWPEPDQIRRLTRKTDPAHATPLWDVPKFPRAAFGMPIIFHFQSKQDPGDTTLQPAGYERLASPLVLRPVVDDTGVYAVALRLPRDGHLAQVLKKLTLKGTNLPADGNLTAAEAGTIRPLDGQPDVLKAFLHFFKNS